MNLYVGTFSHHNSDALHVCAYDPGSGDLRSTKTVGGVINPAFMALSPCGRMLYTVSEVSGGREGSQPVGEVAAFAIDPRTGDLDFVNRQSAMGPRPCHITIDLSGQWVFVANYRGESFSVLPVEFDGRLGTVSTQIRHSGSSIDSTRQRNSHPHSCTLHPSNRWLYVADLGMDKLVVYDFDAATGALSEKAEVAVAPGSGPRHFRFHPILPFAYLTNEMSATLTVFEVGEDGLLTERQTVSTLPSGYEGRHWNSEIALSPDGLYLYAANRGHDSIAIFSIEKVTGMLAFVAHEATRGSTPRHFALDPLGRRLVVGNQDSNTLVVFDRDAETGLLTFHSLTKDIDSPTCLLFQDARS
jgi:6-phosphogluconolactonase